MANLLDQLDKNLLSLVSQSGRIAAQLNYQAYLVGGPVRDLMLERSNVDLDITVEGNAIRLAGLVAKENPGATLVEYPAFRTATVSLPDGRTLDFATARTETYVKGGAYPAVVPSDIYDDLFRRDFTINAMALSINPDTWGQLTDPFDGSNDLKAKKIRILHEQSFEDDPTRIIRAARFKARLGFTMDQGTLAVLKQAVKTDVLLTIKKQRYAKEFNKILNEEHSEEAIKCLKAWNAYLDCAKQAKED